MSTINKVKVVQMSSPRSYRPIANQFIINTDEGEYFQSYASLIVFKSNDGKIYLDENKWDYSMTTSKYRNEFLGEDTKTTREKIKEGQYILADLN